MASVQLEAWIIELVSEKRIALPVVDAQLFKAVLQAGFSKKLANMPLDGEPTVGDDPRDIVKVLVALAHPNQRKEIIWATADVLELSKFRSTEETVQVLRQTGTDNSGVVVLREKLDEILIRVRSRFPIQLPIAGKERAWLHQIVNDLLDISLVLLVLNNIDTCLEILPPVDPLLLQQPLVKMLFGTSIPFEDLSPLAVEQMTVMINESWLPDSWFRHGIRDSATNALRRMVGRLLTVPLDYDLLACFVINVDERSIGKVHGLAVRIFDRAENASTSRQIEMPQLYVQDTRLALERAYKVVCHFLEIRRPDLLAELRNKVIGVFLDELHHPIGGESLALPVALAIISHLTLQQVRPKHGGNIVVTGDLQDDDQGTILHVKGVEAKLEAVIRYQNEAKDQESWITFVLPAQNAESLPAHLKQLANSHKVDIVGVTDLVRLVYSSDLLVDIWNKYRQSVLAEHDTAFGSAGFPAANPKIDLEQLNELKTAISEPGGRVAVFCEPGIENASRTAKSISFLLSSETTNTIPVILGINTSNVFRTIGEQLANFGMSMPRSDIALALESGRFTLVIPSISDVNPGRFIEEQDGLNLLENDYPKNNIIWVLPEHEWSMNKVLLERKRNSKYSREYRETTLLLTRRTTLDADADNIMQQAAARILACNRPLEIPISEGVSGNAVLVNVQAKPFEFFARPDIGRGRAHYIPTQLEPYKQDERSKESTSLSSLVDTWSRKNADPLRILILAEAGFGKTTELLHLAYQCLYTSNVGGAEREVIPLLISSSFHQNGRPDFAHQVAQSVGSRSSQIASEVGRHNKDIIENRLLTEIQNTPGCVLLFDGLDEMIASAGGPDPERYEQNVGIFRRSFSDFIFGLPDSVGVIITARKSSPGGPVERFLEQEPLTKFSVYSMLPLKPTDGLHYLYSLGRRNEAEKELRVEDIYLSNLLDALIERIGGKESDVLTRPIMVYLLSTLVGIQVETELPFYGLESDTQLNTGLIYRLTIDRWLRQEFDEYGYYDLRYRQKRKPSQVEKIKMPQSAISSKGISREFYERVLEQIALTALLGMPPLSDQFHELRHPQLTWLLYNFFLALTKGHKRAPAWWPRVERREPWGMDIVEREGNESYQLYDNGRELDELAEALLGGTLLREHSSSTSLL